MANVHSVLLFEGANSSSAPVVSPGVPAGYVWVVREIVTAFGEGTDSVAALYGINFTVGGGWPLFSVSGWEAAGGQVYQCERRMVMNVGENLQAQSYDVGWYWRISGYQLTLP